jgi:hypothetical protein
MVDLTDPSPLVMTRFEAFAFYSALAGVALTVALDLWRRFRRRR